MTTSPAESPALSLCRDQQGDDQRRGGSWDFCSSSFSKTTGSGPPLVLLWVAVLLSWGLLQGPNRPAHLDQTGHNRHPPSAGDLLDNTERDEDSFLKHLKISSKAVFLKGESVTAEQN